jgi:hypothetical protein
MSPPQAGQFISPFGDSSCGLLLCHHTTATSGLKLFARGPIVRIMIHENLETAIDDLSARMQNIRDSL